MKRFHIAIGMVAGCCGSMIFSVYAAESIKTPPVKVIHEIAHDVSLPLRDLILLNKTPLQLSKEVPIHIEKLKLGTSEDEGVQLETGLPLQTIPGLAFAGLGDDYPGFTVTVNPPDTNASVGLTQVVQWVNTSYVVFNKATGQAQTAPIPGNTIWNGFTGPNGSTLCQDTNKGDPIVKFDRMANRWVMTQFAYTDKTVNLQCVAVSKTPDITGEFYRYAYTFNNVFNDYGKLGVWPDGYYMSFEMFGDDDDDEHFTALPTDPGPAACVLDRVKMLAGEAATMQCFQPRPTAGQMLPSDLDGAALPPTGMPNYFVGLLKNAQGTTSQSSLALWKFHVDWQNPNNSYFAGPTALPVKPFNLQICPDPRSDCVAQPGTSQLLEVLVDRMMYRLAYRNFGRYQSMVVNHNVQLDNGALGTRWYEIRVNDQGTAVVYQQGTYTQHDNNSRWMGSIAMDKLGNMALGYSVSGPSVYPSIRYTGRVYTDPINTMRTEITLKNGAGSQLKEGPGDNRWGDYSSMAIDPSDDCTFWYTTEYLLSTGAAWSTWLGSFKFPNCR